VRNSVQHQNTDNATLFILVGTQKAIGVAPPDEALLFVILSPVGPYYASGFKPVSLYGTTKYVRAAPGGDLPSTSPVS
jgi:branched-subunit amino acid aminotransferase/4-amino-4-deoxychorismate lyase